MDLQPRFFVSVQGARGQRAKDWKLVKHIAKPVRLQPLPRSIEADAPTGLVATLRFNGTENMVTRVFGRWTGQQNRIFQRPDAVGGKGALQVDGNGEKAAFDCRRV